MSVQDLLSRVANHKQPISAIERIGFAVMDSLAIDQRIRSEQVPASVLKNLMLELDVDEKSVLSLVSISRATSHRRITLKPDEAGRVFRVASILALSEEVLGGHSQGVRWLKSPARFLGGETPLNLIKTEAGAEAVRNMLFRIEYSVYS